MSDEVAVSDPPPPPLFALALFFSFSRFFASAAMSGLTAGAAAAGFG